MPNSDILTRFQKATAKISPRLAQPGAQPAQPARARLIFGMDATASRQPSWDLACTTVAAMFDAAGKVGGLDVQLCHFGGMTPPRAGPWVADARQLVTVMTMVTCRAGITQIGSCSIMSAASMPGRRSPLSYLSAIRSRRTARRWLPLRQGSVSAALFFTKVPTRISALSRCCGRSPRDPAEFICRSTQQAPISPRFEPLPTP